MEIFATESLIIRVADCNPKFDSKRLRQGNYPGKSHYSEHLLMTDNLSLIVFFSYTMSSPVQLRNSFLPSFHNKKRHREGCHFFKFYVFK